MKALILRQNSQVACATSKVLIDKGFQILCVETLAVAHALIRIDTIDLLVMDETFEGQLTHAIALSGERRSPYLSAIMLTDRPRAVTDDLYELIPCLYALAGTETSPHVLGQLALAAVSNIDEAVSRVAARAKSLATVADDADADDEDALAGDPSYADIAIAAPEMAAVGFADQTASPLVLHQTVDRDVAQMLQAQPFYRSAQRAAGNAPTPV